MIIPEGPSARGNINVDVAFQGQVSVLTLLHTAIIAPQSFAPQLNKENSIHFSGVLGALSENRHTDGRWGVFS